MELDALGIWILISVTAPGEIITTSETWQGCDYARGVYVEALDPDYDTETHTGLYGRGVNPEIEKLAKCVFIPYEDLTPPEDL